MRFDHNAPAAHAFAHIIVGITREVEVDAAGQPHTQALPCGAVEVDVERLAGIAAAAVFLGNHARQGSAHRAVEIADVEAQIGIAAALECLLRLLDNGFIEQTFVKRGVVLGAEARTAFGHFGRIQKLAQIQPALFGGFAFDNFQ